MLKSIFLTLCLSGQFLILWGYFSISFGHNSILSETGQRLAPTLFSTWTWVHLSGVLLQRPQWSAITEALSDPSFSLMFLIVVSYSLWIDFSSGYVGVGCVWECMCLGESACVCVYIWGGKVCEWHSSGSGVGVTVKCQYMRPHHYMTAKLKW